jgi:serine/threonine protein kinase
MDFVAKKDKIKDYLIISLIDTIIELYSYNYNIDKELVRSNLISKLEEMNILEIDLSQNNIIPIKKEIIQVLTDQIPTNRINNISLFENFKSHEIIGKGGFSNVYKVFNPLDERYYAIKKIGIKNNFHDALNEVRSIAKLSNENLVRYHISWIESINLNKKFDKINENLLLEEQNDTALIKFDNLNLSEDKSIDTTESNYNELNYDKFIFIQMELCKETLKCYLNNNKLDFTDKLSIIKQVIKGLIFIHQNNIIHRDLKLTNIFISLNNTIKIGDFGLATNIYDVDNDEVGTYGYIAPEIFKGEKCSFNSDLYSLGVIILEVFKNFKTNMEKVLCLKDVKNKNFLELDNENIQNIILSLLNENPEKRMKLNNILELIS